MTKGPLAGLEAAGQGTFHYTFFSWGKDSFKSYYKQDSPDKEPFRSCLKQDSLVEKPF